MSKPIEILNKRIETDKEILSVMPKNTKKNTNIYLEKVNEIESDYQNYLNDILLEIKRRANRINNITENPEIGKIESELKKFDDLDLFEEMNTSYEKMKLDEILFELRRFYKNNLEQVNNNIAECIKKFEKAGIKLNAEDFNYSPFVNKYMEEFFKEYQKGDINSQKMKETFEEIYWECSDIIIHIELNIKYLYLKEQKEIDKYYVSRNKEVCRELKISEKEYLDKYTKTRQELDELKASDKRLILNKFIQKEMDIKDYEKKAMDKQYAKLLENPIENYTKTEFNEIRENIIKLSKSIEEYKKYIEYKFILDKILKIFNEKDKYKNEYEKQKKQIQKSEKKLQKTNKKYIIAEKHKNIIFFKNKENLKKLVVDINNQILAIKKLYRELDRSKTVDRIITYITENTTIYEVLFLASSYYTFLAETIMEEFPEISGDDFIKKIKEIREFVTSPYITILKNITIKESKDMVIMIKDKYNLFKINISKNDLDESSIDALNNTVNLVVNDYNIEKSGLNLDDVKYIMQANKILENINEKS